MDFNNRSVPTQHQAEEHRLPTANLDGNLRRPNSSNKSQGDDKWTRAGIFAGFVAVVVLIVAAIVLIANNNTLLSANNNNTNDKSEVSFVKSDKLQAVFLNTGQVYFGNISSLNNNYLILNNIFYLQTSSSSSSTSTASTGSNVTLVKLGCELHKPYDQMVINRAQVTFWENLQSSGQVATAVATYEKDNPGPQKCVDQTSSSSTTSGTATQNANSGTTGTGTTTTGQ
jgi:hypothetical protein